jgi:hypothetical protein
MANQPALIFNLHGLHVRSELPLPAPLVETDHVDLDVGWGEPLEDAAPIAGRPVARLQLPDGRGYSMVRTDAGWTLRFEAIADFRFDDSLRNVRVRLAPGGNSAFVPLLLAGNVAALILSLGGHRLLHASAVELEGEGFGFLGDSGAGKSTLAALCCADGAKLIADDLLRVEPSPNGFRCVRGPSEIRLRPSAGLVADSFLPISVKQTPDDRLALSVTAADNDDVLLRALAVSHPSRECSQLSVERLGRVEALYALNRYARVSGWRAPELLGRQFTGFSEVAASVPVYRLVIPWGPPFQKDLGRVLLETLRSQVRAEPAA